MISKYLIAILLYLGAFGLAYGEQNMFMNEIPKVFAPPVAEDDFDKELLKQIKEIGWYNVHVAGENEDPSFAFSIGHFEKNNHPEIIVIGLPAEVADKLLNIAVVKITGAKSRIEPYKKYSDFTESLSLVFVPVEMENYREYLGYANWYYGSLPKPYPALQMVWPDKAGKFPWESGYDKRFSKLQPILGKAP